MSKLIIGYHKTNTEAWCELFGVNEALVNKFLLILINDKTICDFCL